MLEEEMSHDACADKYLTDQLIIFMALAKGKSSLLTGKLELHTETAIHFARVMTGAVFCVTRMNHGNLIECEGIGLENKFLS